MTRSDAEPIPQDPRVDELGATLVGRVAFDDERLAADLETTRTFPLNASYNAYSRGVPGWRNCVLANPTGRIEDNVFGGHDGPVVATPLLDQVPYIDELLWSTFSREHLLWCRLFICEDGMLVPHRDYLDLPEDDFTRIHLALELGPTSLHSERRTLFRMRRGEIWYIDGSVDHSAASYDGAPRTYLSCDFPSGIPFEDLVDPHAIAAAAGTTPDFVERPPLPADFARDVEAAVRLTDPASIDELIGVFSRFHYRFASDCGDVYDWIIDAADRNGQVDVAEKARERREFFLGV